MLVVALESNHQVFLGTEAKLTSEQSKKCTKYHAWREKKRLSKLPEANRL